MSRYSVLQRTLRRSRRTWLVTGVAGFIGSNLLEKLLLLDQAVVGLDNFATGRRDNLADVKSRVTSAQWKRFRFREGDLCQLDDCRKACAGADYILHQAALGSVPRSIADPVASHASNVSGFVNMLVAAKEARVRRTVYASSSSVYGDHPKLPKVEHTLGQPLSPYAATKLMDEIYARVFHRSYGLSAVGLRYFNVFGPRQDPAGAYAAVIPRWFAALRGAQPVYINGDGQTSRDFCFIENVVQANLLAATATAADPCAVYNIACGRRTTLTELFAKIRDLVADEVPAATACEPIYRPERAGDVRHSHADIRLAGRQLGYVPSHTVDEGLAKAAAWYLRTASRSP